MFTINCKGKVLNTKIPLVMGIVNITPDSFFKGHLNEGTEKILSIVEKMISEGADILDIGGQSSRPGSERISAADELARVIPIIKLIRQQYKEIVLSIDTYHSLVAENAGAAGVDIVNDISSGEMDKQMISTVAALQVPYISMHMKGTPETMQKNTSYENLLKDILEFFIQKTNECKTAGINDIIIDPGFGFSKTIQQNFELLKNLEVFKMLDKPILAGLSRKSTVYKTLNTTAEKALNGTTVLNTIALNNGADILRVHDVKEAKEAVLLMARYKNLETN